MLNSRESTAPPRKNGQEASLIATKPFMSLVEYFTAGVGKKQNNQKYRIPCADRSHPTVKATTSQCKRSDAGSDVKACFDLATVLFHEGECGDGT